jgi:hypothetical protein
MTVREWDEEIAVPEIQMTREEIKEKLREYEECYQLSSEQFHWQWKQGKAPDIPESVAWAIFYEYLQKGRIESLRCEAELTEA